MNNPNPTKIANQIDKLPCSDEVKAAVSQLVGTVVSEITGTSFNLPKKITARDIHAGARFATLGATEPHLTLVDASAMHMHFKDRFDTNRSGVWLLCGLCDDPYRTYSNGPFTTEQLVAYVNSQNYRKV